MPTDTKVQFDLTVQTSDEAAEIFIIDSQFQRVKSGLGKECNFPLPPGLYSVKIRVGFDYQENSIALFKNEIISFNPIQFSSPAPLEDTSKIHEFHIANAVAHSNEVHVTLGQGSQIFLFSRDWTGKTPSFDSPTSQGNPAIGLTLRNLQDEILVDFAEPNIGFYSSNWDPWYACNVQLNSDVYFLCLQTATGECIKQTIVASPTWQTQIFLLQQTYSLKGKDVRADLSNSSIFMSRIGYGFHPKKSNNIPGEPDSRLAEVLRQALVNNRYVINKEIIDQMLNDKLTNPMLGIYGVHLMLLNKKSDQSILPAVINNLRKLLVQPHPDVEALALKLNLPSNYTYNAPPMLRLSWNYVLEASVESPNIVPESSIATEIAGTLWSGDPWLLWGYASKKIDSTNMLIEQLKVLIKNEEISVQPSNPPPDELMSMPMDNGLDLGNANVLSMPQLGSEETLNYFGVPEKKMDEEQIHHYVQVLGVPRSRLESMLKTIDTSKSAKEKSPSNVEIIKYRKSAFKRRKRTIRSWQDIIKNLNEFKKISENKDTEAYKRFSQFHHWYYFPEEDAFAPAKFLSYKGMTVRNYKGVGHVGEARKILQFFFDEIPKNSDKYKVLLGKLQNFAQSIDKTISKKTLLGNGGIYIPKRIVK